MMNNLITLMISNYGIDERIMLLIIHYAYESAREVLSRIL